MRAPRVLPLIVGLFVLCASSSGRATDRSGATAVDSRDLLERGILALTAGELAEADLLLSATVEAGRASGHLGLLFGGLTHLAGVRVEQDRVAAGLALMAEAIPVADALAGMDDGAPPDLGVTVRMQIAELLAQQGRLPDAESMAWDALQVSVDEAALVASLPVARRLVALAVEQGAAGDELTLRAVEMDELLSGLPGYQERSAATGSGAVAALLGGAGRELSGDGAIEEAAGYFEAALALYVAAGRESDARRTCRDLAWTALQRDDRGLAAALIRRCELPTLRGELRARQGRFVEARKATAGAALDGYPPESEGDRYELAVRMGRIARLLSADGDFTEAEASHRRAAEMFEAVGRPAEALAETVEAGVALLRAGQALDAGTLLDQAIDSAAEDGRPLHPEARLRALLARSVVRAGRGSWEAARDDVAAAGEGLFELRRSRPLAATAAELASLRAAAGDPEAREAFERAVDFEAEVGLTDEGRWGLEGLGTLLADAEPDAAIEAWTASLDRADRWTRGRLVPDLLRGEAYARKLGEPLPHPLIAEPDLDGPRRAVGLLVDAGRVDEAFVLSERIRGLEWRRILEEDPDPRVDAPHGEAEARLMALREQADAIRDRARSLAFGGSADPEAERRDLLNHLEIFRTREADLLDALPALQARSLGPARVDLAAVQAGLGPRTLLSFVRSGDRLVVFTITSAELTARVAEVDWDAIADGVFAEVRTRGAFRQARVRRARRELSDVLLSGDVGGARLVVVLDDVLHHARLPDLPGFAAAEGIALLPAAALVSAPAPERGGEGRGACTVHHRRPLAAALGPPPPTRPGLDDLVTGARPLELVDFARGGLPATLECVVRAPKVDVGRVDVGPGRAAEALPGAYAAGSGWVALGELAAQVGGGVLIAPPGPDGSVAARASEAFRAAVEAGSPPDVAVMQVARTIPGVRWLAPAGLSP